MISVEASIQLCMVLAISYVYRRIAKTVLWWVSVVLLLEEHSHHLKA